MRTMMPMEKVEVLRAACCVAGVDGDVSADEREFLEKLAEEVGVGRASLRAMIEQAEQDKKFWKEHFRVLKTDPKQTMEILFRVACTDRRLRKYELAVLKRLARRLDVSDKQFDAWVKQLVNRSSGSEQDNDG